MHKPGTGISGFGDYRFWLALVFYGASLPLFFEGGMSWDSFQLAMPFLIAFVIVTTVAWDYRIIGNPNDAHCLVLHTAFLVSLIFLLNRLISANDFAPRMDILSGMGAFVFETTRNLPYVHDLFGIFDFVLKWLGFAIVLFFVSGAIIFSQRIALALLFLFGLFTVALSVGRSLDSSLWSLFLGIILMILAFRLQMEDERKNRFWNRVAEALRRAGPRPRMDMSIKTSLLRLMGEEKAVSEKQIRGLVAAKLNCRSDDPRLSPVCARIADQLASQDGLAESRDGNQGWRFVLTLPEESADFYTVCARVVRIIVTLGFCIIYILSPIDLIPDATPVFGVVDDMLLGAVGLLSVIKTVYGGNRLVDRTLDKLPFQRTRDL